MSTKITVTKVASVYIELEKDIPETINANFISNVVPVPAKKEIGSAIISFGMEAV